MADTDKLNKRRWQFGLLLALMLPVGGGLFTLFPHTEPVETDRVNPGATLSQHLLQSGAGVSPSGVPGPKLPPNYKEQGTVDDRYTVAVDSNTGETVIHDALGGVGTNNTSVEGDRVRLAKDMLALEQYADQHKRSMKPQDYNWLKRMARAGMQLAFGTPGLPPLMQPPIKTNLLSQFHDISANPTQSLMRSSLFPQIEQSALTAETTYQSMPTSLALSADTAVMPPAAGSLLATDPVYSTLSTTTASYTAPDSLSSMLSSTLLVPSTTTLATAATGTATTSSTTTISGVDATSALKIDPTATTVAGTTSTSPTLNTSTMLAPLNTTLATTSTVTNTSTVLPTLDTSTSLSTSLSTTSGISASLDLSVTGLSAGTTLMLSPSTTTSTLINTSTTTALLDTSLTTTTSLSSDTSTSTSTTTQTTTVQEYYDALLGPIKY